jgi:hypothetical protein
MDLDFTAAEDAFRVEARDWLTARVPSVPLPSLETAEGFAAHREWEGTLFADRWSVVSWPEQFGGRGSSLLEWLVFEPGPPAGSRRTASTCSPPRSSSTGPTSSVRASCRPWRAVR